ncbi:DsrE family protein [Candidatus Magnetominusculus dajiuhuensis]|uniref:DsrE family protein n=1 Tax=Candidatus Magnetominusculus dajiuhuensis TaxID=3137712 RepID=UPI001A099E7F|nr:DsrE family protein [Nitrospirota bacterium]
MKKIYMIVLIFFISVVGSAYAAEGVKVDIPVVLKDVKVVFNMDHLAFDGDKPVGLKYMLMMAEQVKKSNAIAKVIAIFHGAAAYMTLADEPYNKSRKITTGNPYKKLIADMLAAGVEVEECATSMGANGWVNADLLPGVKVNGGAVLRLIMLGQEGYIAIQP